MSVLVTIVFLTSLSLLNLYASVVFLEIMSIDRYLSVVYPMRMIRLRTRNAVVKICAGVWVLAILIALKVCFSRD